MVSTLLTSGPALCVTGRMFEVSLRGRGGSHMEFGGKLLGRNLTDPSGEGRALVKKNLHNEADKLDVFS